MAVTAMKSTIAQRIRLMMYLSTRRDSSLFRGGFPEPVAETNGAPVG
jgi:hypothetical protein